jgi:hypothetical protein
MMGATRWGGGAALAGTGGGRVAGWLAAVVDRVTGRRGDARPPAERPVREQRIVRVTTARNEPLALLTRQVLEGEGIRVMLKPIGPGYGGWGNANNLMHDVYVLEGDEQRAREVLETVRDGEGIVLPGDG